MKSLLLRAEFSTKLKNLLLHSTHPQLSGRSKMRSEMLKVSYCRQRSCYRGRKSFHSSSFSFTASLSAASTHVRWISISRYISFQLTFNLTAHKKNIILHFALKLLSMSLSWVCAWSNFSCIFNFKCLHNDEENFFWH